MLCKSINNFILYNNYYNIYLTFYIKDGHELLKGQK